MQKPSGNQDPLAIHASADLVVRPLVHLSPLYLIVHFFSYFAYLLTCWLSHCSLLHSFPRYFVCYSWWQCLRESMFHCHRHTSCRWCKDHAWDKRDWKRVTCPWIFHFPAHGLLFSHQLEPQWVHSASAARLAAIPPINFQANAVRKSALAIFARAQRTSPLIIFH